jgi:hypothetical protein
MSNTIGTVVQPTTQVNDEKVKQVIESIITLIKAKHLS